MFPSNGIMLREFCLKYFLQATESDEDAYGDYMETLDVSKSPEKPINQFKQCKCEMQNCGFRFSGKPVPYPLSFQLPE